MDLCSLFKSLVGGQWSFDGRNRCQSIEIVPLQSCCKHIMQHKSLWQFQDVKSEVDLILVRAAMFTMPQNVNTMTISSITSFIPWSWLDKGNREGQHAGPRKKWAGVTTFVLGIGTYNHGQNTLGQSCKTRNKRWFDHILKEALLYLKTTLQVPPLPHPIQCWGGNGHNRLWYTQEEFRPNSEQKFAFFKKTQSCLSAKSRENVKSPRLL